MIGKKTVRDIDLKGKRVLVRVDFNVPIDEHGNIEDDSRIRSSLSTIEYLLDSKAKIILMSHLGRPKGFDEKYSLKPVAKRLSRLLHKEIMMAPDCIGKEVEDMANSLKEEDVLMLENLRFHEEEEKCDMEFAKALAKLGDIYVSDAFGTCHRKHASVFCLPQILKPAVAGFLLEKELEYFSKAMINPKRPVVAFLGGAKVSSKLGIIKNLLKRVDKIFIGGAMAFTFIKALGYETGKSLVENDLIDTAKDIIEISKKLGVKLYLPFDFIVSKELSNNVETKNVLWQEIPDNYMGLDIGKISIEIIKELVKDAQTIIWNGPMGAFEYDRFKDGTFETAKAIANSNALSIAGGGDTDHAIIRAGVHDSIDFISTGGGAFLELLEGKELPCISVLDDK